MRKRRVPAPWPLAITALLIGVLLIGSVVGLIGPNTLPVVSTRRMQSATSAREMSRQLGRCAFTAVRYRPVCGPSVRRGGRTMVHRSVEPATLELEPPVEKLLDRRQVEGHAPGRTARVVDLEDDAHRFVVGPVESALPGADDTLPPQKGGWQGGE